jgi:hypothetical protein
MGFNTYDQDGARVTGGHLGPHRGMLGLIQHGEGVVNAFLKAESSVPGTFSVGRLDGLHLLAMLVVGGEDGIWTNADDGT